MTKTIKVFYTVHTDRNSDAGVTTAVFHVSEDVFEDLMNPKFSPFPCYFNFPIGRKQANLCRMVLAYAAMHEYYILKSDRIISVIED